MTSAYHRVLLVFLDGVGLASIGDSNPFSRYQTPAIEEILGGPLTLESVDRGSASVLEAIDATLGVEGLPQSATGQTALFTGKNASQKLGHHATGLPGPAMRTIIESGNLFSWATERGLRATFANAYTTTYLEAIRAGTRRPSVTTSALLASGLEPRGLVELTDGRAVSWDIRRDHFRKQQDLSIPIVSPQQAGWHLGRVASEYDLTVYESFLTDLAGHRRLGFAPEETLHRIDGLFEGLLGSVSEQTTILVTSDHGNFEESDHKRHTRNPIPLLSWGPLTQCFVGVESILDVTPRVLNCLSGDGATGRRSS